MHLYPITVPRWPYQSAADKRQQRSGLKSTFTPECDGMDNNEASLALAGNMWILSH